MRYVNLRGVGAGASGASPLAGIPALAGLRSEEAEPAPIEVRLERRGGVVVAVPARPVPRMGAAVVEETIASLRARRTESRRTR